MNGLKPLSSEVRLFLARSLNLRLKNLPVNCQLSTVTFLPLTLSPMPIYRRFS
ncbi:MAG: hypothetical protein HC786_08840 [Richelia sp. CSU_2_1]|nr:hypothetical protein [Microcoleus sp. SU_5_6]NJL66177.1 hypothetical protein [Microcoleus sp. SM1_3_4]NJR22253.1 hypothetical protein [Richelia sp. CSU_2_1]